MTIEMKCRKLTPYSMRFFKMVVPSPSMTSSGRLCSYLKITNIMTPMTAVQTARQMRLGSCCSFRSGRMRTSTINTHSMLRAETQNHVAFAMELSVIKKGIPWKVSVCNKSSIPTMKNKKLSIRIFLDCEKPNAFQPYEKIEKETAILKNSKIV